MADTNVNLSEMSIEDLESYIQDLSRERDSIRARQLDAHKELDRKNVEKAVSDRLNRMPGDEREMFLQALAANGIESQESVQL